MEKIPNYVGEALRALQEQVRHKKGDAADVEAAVKLIGLILAGTVYDLGEVDIALLDLGTAGCFERVVSLGKTDATSAKWNLPSPVTVAQYGCQDTSLGRVKAIYAFWESGGKLMIKCLLWTEDKKKWLLNPYVLELEPVLEQRTFDYRTFPRAPIDDIAMEECILGALNTLALCVAPGTKRIIPARTANEVVRAKAQLLNKKTPKWDWTTIVIEPKVVEVQPYKGGTHASPREHERRGHFRNLKSGKRVFVRSFTVGKKELGRVDHDYIVRGV